MQQVGKALLIDASDEEQQCASCVLSIAVNKQGNCCGIEYLKHGILKSNELSACIEVNTESVMQCVIVKISVMF